MPSARCWYLSWSMNSGCSDRSSTGCRWPMFIIVLVRGAKMPTAPIERQLLPLPPRVRQRDRQDRVAPSRDLFAVPSRSTMLSVDLRHAHLNHVPMASKYFLDIGDRGRNRPARSCCTCRRQLTADAPVEAPTGTHRAPSRRAVQHDVNLDRGVAAAVEDSSRPRFRRWRPWAGFIRCAAGRHDCHEDANGTKGALVSSCHFGESS